MYRIYFYKFLTDFWVIVPILVPFYKSNGMTAARILTIQAAFSISQLLFEIPSGYLSDVIGRKKTLILAAVFMLLGLCIYVFSSSFSLFIIAEVILGIAGALRSGTDSAFLYDHLKSINDEHLYMKCEGHAEFWSRTGNAVSSIAGGKLHSLYRFCSCYLNIQVVYTSSFLHLLQRRRTLISSTLHSPDRKTTELLAGSRLLEKYECFPYSTHPSRFIG